MRCCNLGRWLLSCVALLPRPAASQGPQWRLLLDSIVAPGAEFGTIRQMVALDATSAAVLDTRTNEIAIVRVDIRAAQLISRSGAGPGEFVWANSIGRYRDSIWVYAAMDRKFALLPITGGRGTTLTPRFAGGQLQPGANWNPRAVMSPGWLLITLAYDPQAQYDSASHRAPVWIMPREGTPRREVAQLASFGNRYIRFADAPGSTSFRNNPFAGGDLLLPAPDGSGFVILRQQPTALTSPARITIESYDAGGRRTNVVAINLPALPDASARMDSVMRTMMVDLRAPLAISEVRAQLGPAGMAPVTSRAFLASDGTVWIRRFGLLEGPGTWARVVLPAGEIGTIDVSGSCTPLDAIAGRVWLGCVEHDIPVVRRGWLRMVR